MHMLRNKDALRHPMGEVCKECARQVAEVRRTLSAWVRVKSKWVGASKRMKTEENATHETRSCGDTEHGRRGSVRARNKQERERWVGADANERRQRKRIIRAFFNERDGEILSCLF